MTNSYPQNYQIKSTARLCRHVVFVLLASGLGCSRDRAELARQDSALDRDLTLASAAESRPPGVSPLGDTAASAPRTPSPAGSPSNQAEPNRRPPRASTPTRTPSRPSAEVEPSPLPTTATAPATPPSTAPEPAASTPAPAAAPRVIGAGTALVAQTTGQLCSLANRPGDKIVANLSQEVVGPDGARLPVGTPVLVEMAAAEPPAEFAFRVRGVQVDGRLIPVEGRVTMEGATTDRRVAKGGDKGKVITGAVIGGILGRVMGGGTKGTVIGAAGGAAAGSVMAARNSTVEHCLPVGATITVTLTSALVFPAPSQ